MELSSMTGEEESTTNRASDVRSVGRNLEIHLYGIITRCAANPADMTHRKYQQLDRNDATSALEFSRMDRRCYQSKGGSCTITASLATCVTRVLDRIHTLYRRKKISSVACLASIVEERRCAGNAVKLFLEERYPLSERSFISPASNAASAERLFPNMWSFSLDQEENQFASHVSTNS